ncbi:FHA domain-containing protein [Tsukamurella sp. 8F]|uniref:FHA domain-containing protein n=1 Tax=unclassified Tsukamurella TaxID=2633480 RepID=UPI0023B90B15|nr:MULTISPECIES: FHA domain-containing protein [unclassified Tsukamurella]MDF0529808.1 FHA domain-containing protein [Tsukamurella sp. 8J]MDF0587000.1 FHA domain-containing protein [Tsukamurella sp. 8F]
MNTCPQGHSSSDDEFCDVCGLSIGGGTPPPAGAAPSALSGGPDPAPPPGARCVACGGELAGRFCEECGHDSLQPVAAASASTPTSASVAAPQQWTAIVTADRTYFDSVIADEGPDAGGITFPPFCPDRTFSLDGTQVTVGRASRSRGIHPDIDLTGPPEDPGVSHLHAVLLARDDGDWSVIDLGSSNGTSVNGDPLAANAPRPVGTGDIIHLGAWTRITLRPSGDSRSE